jgi:predicted dehydrogenase
MSNNKTLRWGIIGCGNVTEMKSGPAFNKVANSSLVAVMRRDELKLKAYALKHNVPLTFTNATDLIHCNEVDAVYIATPPHVHETYALQVIAAGKPVYIEKPMALNVASCERIHAAAQKANVKLVIAHYRRALPLFMRVKELLDQNTIGSINEVVITMHKPLKEHDTDSSNWRVDPSIAGAGYFYDLAPHQLDLLFYFFGEAVSYQGKATNQSKVYAAEDTVVGEVVMKNGVTCKGDWCFCAQESKDEFLIKGTLGSIAFPVFGHMITTKINGVAKEEHFEPPMHNQQGLIEKIVPYFMGGTINPCSANDAIQSMRVMEAFVCSK